MTSYKNLAYCSCLLLAAHSFVDVKVADALSSTSSKPKLKRPLVSLTGSGDVSGFLYGKIQRATSLYGSGLVGPATAVVHGARDTKELLPKRIVALPNNDNPQRMVKDLDTMLWKQFGMATCEGSAEREDVLAKPSYLKPRLAELEDTIVFLDATTTTTSTSGAGSSGGASAAAGGLGGLLSNLMGGAKNDDSQQQQQPQKQQKQQPKKKTNKSSDCWLDVDLVRTAITRGSQVFVVCESHDTAYCAKTLNKLLSALRDETNGALEAGFATIVSPEDGVVLGGGGDASWNSLRPQDLEGELSQAISVRNASEEFFGVVEGGLSDSGDSDSDSPADNGSQARLAAASADYIAPDRTAKRFDRTLLRHDLAEVCIQCALRLPTTCSGGDNDGSPLRVVRVLPCGNNDDDDPTQRDGSNKTERPNRNYFSMMGGQKTKAREGTVTSVDWVTTLEPLVAGSDGSVKAFPKRPSAL